MLTHSVSTSTVLVTPEIAAEWLQANYQNRAVKPIILDQYISDMREGRWVMNGQPLIFDQDGSLIDGQHRLHAVVKSGVSTEFLIVSGVVRTNRQTIDIGAMRGLGDVLQLDGILSGNKMAAIARAIMAYETNGGVSIVAKSHRISKTALIDRVKADPRIRPCMLLSRNNLIFRGTAIAFCRYVIPDGDKSDTFFLHLDDGIDLHPGNPILTLRNWGISKGRGLSVQDSVEGILRAWIAYRDDRALVRISLRGTLPEL
jgi:hypothetical protein